MKRSELAAKLYELAGRVQALNDRAAREILKGASDLPSWPLSTEDKPLFAGPRPRRGSISERSMTLARYVCRLEFLMSHAFPEPPDEDE